jgi:hypothetical protein
MSEIEVAQMKDVLAATPRWAANVPAPLTREEQIEFMMTAKERLEAFAERIKGQLENDY